jgi:endogenous inhibitor of DNA gyrase (YacG/DUF329 family)
MKTKRFWSGWRYRNCIVCGVPLAVADTGRPRHFCSTRCRVRYHRAMKKWAHDSVEAFLVGGDAIPRPYNHL